MSASIGWGLAVLALVVGYVSDGWPGVLLGAGMIVFWLLLQFGRALRVMRLAAGAPVGQVPNAVMFSARLRRGLRLADVVALARSLGQRVSGEPEVWRWADAGDVVVRLTFERGGLAHWALERPDRESVAPAADHSRPPA